MKEFSFPLSCHPLCPWSSCSPGSGAIPGAASCTGNSWQQNDAQILSASQQCSSFAIYSTKPCHKLIFLICPHLRIIIVGASVLILLLLCCRCNWSYTSCRIFEEEIGVFLQPEPGFRQCHRRQLCHVEQTPSGVGGTKSFPISSGAVFPLYQSPL